MTREPEHPSTHDSKVVATESFGTIAKRIGNLATNVLVTGVILIVGIAFGREVITWWRGDSSTGVASPAAVVGNHVPISSTDPQLLEFGDFPFVLNRQEFVGDVREVLEQLRVACRHAIDSSGPLTRNSSPAERRMLRAAKRLVPVAEQANRWAIYQIETPLPMVVGVRSFDPQVAAADRRVVSWGLAVPGATSEGERQSEWTLFTYLSDTTGEPASERSVWPAPPGGRRTLSLRTDRGGLIVGYVGVGTVESWTMFYEALFGPQSHRDNKWHVDFGIWRRRFVSTQTVNVDVVIHTDGGDTLRSLVLTSP